MKRTLIACYQLILCSCKHLHKWHVSDYPFLALFTATIIKMVHSVCKDGIIHDNTKISQTLKIWDWLLQCCLSKSHIGFCMKQQHLTESSAWPHHLFTSSKPHTVLQPSNHALNNCIHNYIKRLASNVIIIPDHCMNLKKYCQWV